MQKQKQQKQQTQQQLLSQLFSTQGLTPSVSNLYKPNVRLTDGTIRNVNKYDKEFNLIPIPSDSAKYDQFRSFIHELRTTASARQAVDRQQSQQSQQSQPMKSEQSQPMKSQQSQPMKSHRMSKSLMKFLYNWIYLDANRFLVDARKKILRLIWLYSPAFFPNIKTRDQGTERSLQLGGRLLRLSSTVPGAFVVTGSRRGDQIVQSRHDVYIVVGPGTVVDSRDLIKKPIINLIPDILVGDNECGICLKEMRNQQAGQRSIATMTCGHRFHSGCIESLNNRCPMCLRPSFLPSLSVPRTKIRNAYRMRR